MKKILFMLAILFSVLTISGCTGTSDFQPASSESKAATSTTIHPPKVYLTQGQRQAIRSAKEYLDTGGFSRAKLITQLTSKYGEGFKKKDALYAVNHLKVNYNKEALESGQAYLDTAGFSRAGLIRQLTSSYGEGFTKKQATYAVDKLGL
jgi:hypothetical protein